MDWFTYALGLLVVMAMAIVGWLASLAKGNVNLVDSLWSLFFLATAATYAWHAPDAGPRSALVLALVALWALRLALHLALRNWGKPEDHRYQAIRANHSPGFAWKSLVIIFALQATLAWGISLPLAAAVFSPLPLNGLDALGATMILLGLVYEAVADRQLARFKADPVNKARILDRGLWRYSRHPNYFGEACVWWGFWTIALAGSGWCIAGLSLLSPLIMTWLLLRVSGVALLEKDIARRRPAYRDYIARTSAFIPWPPKPAAARQAGETV
jgi:steroid 5-alpha reductase family enzyme